MPDPAPADRRLKCRWCGWSTLAFYTTKDGKKKSGWGKLNNHVEDCHEDEWMAMQDQLGDRDDDDAE